MSQKNHEMYFRYIGVKIFPNDTIFGPDRYVDDGIHNLLMSGQGVYFVEVITDIAINEVG